jgi:outer membrane protein assembly factor BamB
MFRFSIRDLLLLTLAFAAGLAWVYGGRRPRYGAPVDWDIQSGKNIKWSKPLGLSYTPPVVSCGKLFVGTNNQEGFLNRFPPSIDLGALVCVRADDGQFLWQASSPKLGSRTYDHPMYGIEGAALVEGDRLWYVTNRCEVVCLDTEGFYDDQNDGPEQNEHVARGEADIIWTLNMFGTLGVRPHEHCPCTPAADQTRLFVVTGNGVSMSHDKVEAPHAPSFLALDKQTGKVLWSDSSPGTSIMHGQFGSPVWAVLGGVPQAIFPGGDGWVYSFDPSGSADGRSKLLWKFDINPKAAKYVMGGWGTKNEQSLGITVHGGRIYLTCGQDSEHGEGPGYIWCLDPTKRGDVSAELVVSEVKSKSAVTPRRLSSVKTAAGDRIIPNPNSAVIWRYDESDVNGDGAISEPERMHRSLGAVAIRDGILVAADFSGIVHCLDAATGRAFWTHDLEAPCWCAPMISGEHVFICDEDGDVSIFHLPTDLAEMSRENSPISVIDMRSGIFARPTVAERVLYLNVHRRLYAIREAKTD